MEIEIDALSQRPTEAWKLISKSQQVIKMEIKKPIPAISQHKVRVVCMSDTHSVISKIKFEIPDGDIFIHAGDFTRYGQRDEIIDFSSWISGLPHKHKIVIAGNHELTFDDTCTHPLKSNNYLSATKNTGDSEGSYHEVLNAQIAKQHLTNCIYLEDESIEIYGLKIYGTPWQPEFGGWAFNMFRGRNCLEKWNQIPNDVDILITHGPPIGHGDLCSNGLRAGCVELLASIQQRIKPKYHVYGHIHEGYGMTTDGEVIFINASTCNLKYQPINPPIVFDIPLPKGSIKDSDSVIF